MPEQFSPERAHGAMARSSEAGAPGRRRSRGFWKGGAARWALVGAWLFVALAAHAQAPLGVRPPLPDTLRLYGIHLALRVDVPELGPPADARVVTLDEAVALALARNPDRLSSAIEAERAANDATRRNAGYYPDVDFNTRLAGSRTGAAATTGADGTVRRNPGATALTSDISLGYTLFDGNRRAATYRRLRAEGRRAAFTADGDAEFLVRDVTRRLPQRRP